jgi:hypothetical protein
MPPRGGTRREIVLLQNAADSPQAPTATPEPEAIRFTSKTWLLSLLFCTLSTVVSFVYFDVPIARYTDGTFGSAKSLGAGLSSIVLLSGEAAVVLGLMIVRMTRGHLTPFREATALACLTSICAYAINDTVLKFLFGVPNPTAVMHGAQHAFNFLSGSSISSFPSGHMALAGGFGGVFMRLYRRSILPLAALLFIAVVLLVVGD